MPRSFQSGLVYRGTIVKLKGFSSKPSVKKQNVDPSDLLLSSSRCPKHRSFSRVTKESRLHKVNKEGKTKSVFKPFILKKGWVRELCYSCIDIRFILHETLERCQRDFQKQRVFSINIQTMEFYKLVRSFDLV